MFKVHPARSFIFLALAGCFLCSQFLGEALAQCPTPDKIQGNVKKLFPNIEIVKITPAEAKGLCQVQVKLGTQNRILYTDATGDYFLAGNLVEAKSGRNLTMEATQILNRIPPEELRQLEPLTGLTLGQSGKVVYFVTDPQCPYCKQAEVILKKMAEKGEITVRFLFYPLPSHKGAKEQCVAFLCDKKGLSDWEKGYKSDNQCPDGVKKVEDTIAWLSKKGIGSTPTFIFPDGIFHSGLMPEEALRQRLGLPPAGGKPEMKKTSQIRK
ncbi:MAG: DsbC family protein [Deltaproteobacteria bacterium]|nr:DsbC family protein [Deltaproteobacteria bacterium]